MRRPLVLSALVLLGFGWGVAPAQDVNLKLFGAAAYVAPLSESDVDFGTVRESVKGSDELGWNFGLEWRWGKLLGLELDYINSTHDIQAGGTTIGRVDFKPVSASLNIHLIHTTFIDLYAAPTASYVDWGSIEATGSAGKFNISGNINTDSELAWGAQIGLDIGLGKTLAVTGGVRWLNLNLEGTNSSGEKIAIDPLISRVGLAIRF